MATKKNVAAPAAEEKEVKVDFVTRYSKLIYGCLIGVVILVVAGFFFFNHRNKMKEESATRSAAAIAHMEIALASADSTEFLLALEGDGEDLGFLGLLDEYGARGGEAIYLNTAICELNLGRYDEAIAHAEDYDTDDPVMASRALSVIGNAQMQKGNWAEAKKAFLEAAEELDTYLAAYPLLNAGIAAEKLGQLEEALDCYRKIDKRYAKEAEGLNIEAQIARVEALLDRASK